MSQVTCQGLQQNHTAKFLWSVPEKGYFYGLCMCVCMRVNVLICICTWVSLI